MPNYTIESPNRRVRLSVTLDDGSLWYETALDGTVTVERSPIGIVTRDADLTYGLTFIREERGCVDETYTIAAFKKAICRNHANTFTLHFAQGEHAVQVEARAYDDGAAIRLVTPGTGAAFVIHETTSFTVPQTANEVIAQKLLFTYEDQYHPVPASELSQNSLAFPVLLNAGRGVWALYAEAAVFGHYGGSHLASTPERTRTLTVRKSPDLLDDIQTTYPIITPWRVVLMGTLNDIVTSNTLENLNPPSIVDDPSFIRPGLSAWSWMTENDSPQDTKRVYEYVDFAAEMGFPYFLEDGGWPGKVDIPALVEYARQKNVGIWIWEHSAEMRDYQAAEEKMRLWASWGVVGLKIDFFESDKPSRIAQYDMLAELGAKYRLMLNFHGATKPAGESRTWPHVLTREGVLGGEFLQSFSEFLPGGPDASHHCTLPFTRNAVGPMDFTPIVYNTYVTGTTDCHQTALGVIFLSYIQHVGESRERVLENPCRPFLSSLPADWDDGLLLEGYPANHVTMARRKGEDWFVGGICARRPRNAQVSFKFLGDGDYVATVYKDDLSDLTPFDVAKGALPKPDQALCDWIDNEPFRPTLHGHDLHRVSILEIAVNRDTTLTIPMAVNGGFVMHVRQK